MAMEPPRGCPGRKLSGTSMEPDKARVLEYLEPGIRWEFNTFPQEGRDGWRAPSRPFSGRHAVHRRRYAGRERPAHDHVPLRGPPERIGILPAGGTEANCAPVGPPRCSATPGSQGQPQHAVALRPPERRSRDQPGRHSPQLQAPAFKAPMIPLPGARPTAHGATHHSDAVHAGLIHVYRGRSCIRLWS
jgi:hypothetical protein